MRMPSLNVMIGGLAVLGIVVIFAKRPPHSPTGMPMPQAEAPRPVVAPPRRAIVTTPAPLPTVATAVWEIPDPDTLPDDSYGRTVRRGRDLITRTSSLIGPDAPDPAMRYAGNGLDCQSCHIQAGTQQFGIPLAGIWGVFPQYIGRENEVRTLEERVNGCMERSMNGRALPVDGAEMKAILTYIRHISAPERVGQSLVGRGTPPLPLPDRAADPVRGAVVYADTCAACHGAGWHQPSARLTVPGSITLLPLPPYASELNPVENIWGFLRGNHLSITVWNNYDAIVDACCDAWNKLVAEPGRIASIAKRTCATVNI